MAGYIPHPASFKDPSGFVFQFDQKVYRQVNQSYADNYKYLMDSGLYKQLVEKKWLLPHTELKENLTGSEDWYTTLLPVQLPFISYAYEWSFDQLKDAALLTLKIMKTAMDFGMILKDATPFNVQFHEGSPVFIDSLSFEKYDPSMPWIAYRQYCECFLFPLYLSHYLKTSAQKLLSIYLEGIPVEVTAKLLPVKSSLNMGVWLHVYLQNQVKDGKSLGNQPGNFDKKRLVHLIDHLQSIISKFSVKDTQTSTWSNYYTETILHQDYLKEKERIFQSIIKDLPCSRALDAGANDGYFSRILAEKQITVTAIDFDEACINKLYKAVKSNHIQNLLPLCIDLTNPSPALGFNNTERQSFLQRVDFDLVLALALVHHLVLAKNIPMEKVAIFLGSLTTKYLIVEYVPLSDPKSGELIKNKTSYHHYDEAGFAHHFMAAFDILQKDPIPGTERILYTLKKKYTL